MQCRPVFIVGFVVLFLATALLITSLATDYWSKDCYKIIAFNTGCTHRGLWKKGCSYSSNADIKEELKSTTEKTCNGIINRLKKAELKGIAKAFKPWEFAVLALMIIASLIAFIALVTTPCCCHRGGWSMVGEIIFACLLAVAAIGVYAYFVTEKGESTKEEFLWSFWCAVGGAGGLLITAILFSIGSSRSQHVYYSRTL